jgi:hypothetical protein
MERLQYLAGHVNVWTADETKISGTVTLPVGWQIDPTYSPPNPGGQAV